MNVELASAQAGLTVRAARCYETVGLVVPVRQDNGYRDYRPSEVRLLQEIKALTLGLSAEQTRPFLECLVLGYTEADDRPASLAAYRDAISLLTTQIVASPAVAPCSLGSTRRPVAKSPTPTGERTPR
jgi:DNA-binding transcriptional MerR regulator